MSISHILDKYAAHGKTNMPAEKRDHLTVGKNTSQTAVVFGQNVSRLLEERKDVTRVGLAKALGVDARTIARVIAATNAPSLDTVSLFAKFFGMEAWQIVHPDLGGAARQKPVTVGLAVDVLAEALEEQSEASRLAIADRLLTLAKAPDSAKAKAALVSALDPGSSLGEISTKTGTHGR